MAASLLLVAGQVVTLFLLMGIGFVLARMGKMTEAGVGQLSCLALRVVVPCVIINSFQREALPGIGGGILACGVITCGLYALHILITRLFFRKEPPDTRAPLRFSMVYANIGSMGLPLVQSVLGEGAVIYCVMALVAFNLFQWTHGMVAMGGRARIGQALVNPGTIGLAVGLCLFLTGWRLPGVVNSAVGFLSDLNVPIGMIIIGAQMARSDLKAAVTRPRLYLAAGYKLALAPLTALIVLLPLRSNPMLYCVCVILAAAPTAGVTGMLAQQFGRDSAVAAQSVTLSTLLSVITLPVFAAAARVLTGMGIT